MKAFLTLLLLGALGLLWADDNSKSASLTKAETRADAAEQKAQAESQKIQELTAQVNELQGQLNRFRPGSSTPAGPAQTPGSPVPASNPSWFQQRLNGSPTVLDPGYHGH